MKKLTIVLICIISLAACNAEKEEKQSEDSISKPKLTINQEELKRQFGDCETDTSVYCTKIVFKFPVISGIDSTIAESINTKIKTTILNQYLKDSSSVDFKAYTDQFIEDYKTIKSRFGEAFGWYSIINSEVIYSDTTNNILAIQTATSMYTGGAHGTDEMYYLNFNLANGEVYTLGDIFMPGFEAKLNELALSSFKDQTDTTDLPEFNFEENQFYNTNFGLLAEGIKFYYNPYEIAPYSSGASEFFIPYQQLEGIMKIKVNESDQEM